MERRVDLHVHTYYSDGTFSPRRVVEEAKRRGLAAIAISDHDCTDGIEEAKEAGDACGVEIIPAVEITAEKEEAEIHMLGYLIDPKAAPIIGLLKGLRESRIRRMYEMIARLKDCGLDIAPESVFALSKRGTVGRLHLATALYNNGLVKNMKEAFARYIGDTSPCYVRRFNVPPEEAICVILASGGVPVYAHPRVMGRDDFIPGFMKAGLRGLEACHTDHNGKATRYYTGLAAKYGLIITGGSDCHGAGKGRVLMGGVTMPYSVVDELRRERERIRNSRF